MKKLIMIVLLIATVITLASPNAFAATASAGPYAVSATVDSALSMEVVLKKNDSAGAIVTDMNFGNLVDIGTGTLRSSATSTTGTGAVVAFITANSHGLPYTIKQSGQPLWNSSTSLPSGACTVVPVYAEADNGGDAQPSGASIGTAGSWVGDRTIYTSETAGTMKTIQAIYSITDDAAAGATDSVSLSQAGGNYSGAVIITVTT